jgi:octaprenyl-diphosphate synthase
MLVTESNALDTAPRKLPEGALALNWRSISAQVQPFLEQVELRLAEQVRAFDTDIAEFAQYALTQQGKQLRPVLMAFSAGTIGQVHEPVVTAATIVEMVHLATLVHDDIMDAAPVRRGRPSVDARWGSQISVLVGDCLFAQALHLAASFPATDVCRAVSAATKTVCSGEILQTQLSRCFDLDRETYFKILRMKTGELFALSCSLGADLAGGDSFQVDVLRRYGMLLGTAYQLYDDCLDLFGSEEAAGKSLGTDLSSGKLTLPLLVLLERASDREKGRLERMIMAWNREYLAQVLELLEKYEALKECRIVLAGLCQQAVDGLAHLPNRPSRDALQQLPGLFTQQTDALRVDT